MLAKAHIMSNSEDKLIKATNSMYEQGMFDSYKRGFNHILTVLQEDEELGLKLYVAFHQGMMIKDKEKRKRYVEYGQYIEYTRDKND